MARMGLTHRAAPAPSTGEMDAGEDRKGWEQRALLSNASGPLGALGRHVAAGRG